MFIQRFGPSTILLFLGVIIGLQVSLLVHYVNKPVPTDTPPKPPSTVPSTPADPHGEQKDTPCKPPSTVPTTPVEPTEKHFAVEEIIKQNCTNAVLKDIVIQTLLEENDLHEAAVKIGRDASAKFGKYFQAIVSHSEFHGNYWFHDHFCELEWATRFVLAWQTRM